ncbi:transmembrane reductase CYB561D2-like [Coccinella septempunctata]|uniref:transmembrane reductase CYB561D2-like n=1 Tax=Coccinella septempunctata TaxID=41139 RepID=UPI001D07A0A3|nr:transmembrane reductase CYB561D2-like [Coccinella septempunctata]
MEKVKKQKLKKNKKEDIFNLIQFFEIVFVILIIYLVVASVSELVLLDIHVFFSNIGWMLLMVQGILVFRGINPIIRKFLGKDTVFIHWVLETMALIGATMGLISIYQAKNNYKWEHFITWHAVLGFAGILFSIMSGLNGIVALYRKELKNYFPPRLSKFIHILTGTIGFFFGGLSLVFACYTKWFAMRTAHSFLSLCIALFLVIGVVVYTVIQPVDKIRRNWDWKKLTAKE